MTPFGHKLSNSLENERLRMANEWFFPWHGLGYGGRVDVDDFNGRRIRIGGVKFSGSTELVYWSTLRRYLANKINTTFEAAEAEIRATSGANAPAIVEDTSRLLIPFCQRILGEAIETDRALWRHCERSEVMWNDGLRCAQPVLHRCARFIAPNLRVSCRCCVCRTG